MGLTMSQRQAVTKTAAARYRSASRTGKAMILDELCALTGWHRDHAARRCARTYERMEARDPPRASEDKCTGTHDRRPDGDQANFHRMLRRGITYGPELQPNEGPYGETVADIQDRGLLFVSYQSSIARGFEFVQARWANSHDFQQAGDGKDPSSPRTLTARTFVYPLATPSL